MVLAAVAGALLDIEHSMQTVRERKNTKIQCHLQFPNEATNSKYVYKTQFWKTLEKQQKNVSSNSSVTEQKSQSPSRHDPKG